MKAGELRHRVSIQKRTEESDGHDGVTESWLTFRHRVSAKVVQLNGRDLERARAVDPRASWEVTLRYWHTYSETLVGGRARVLFHDGRTGDRQLEPVEPPRETEYREALVMLCKEAA